MNKKPQALTAFFAAIHFLSLLTLRFSRSKLLRRLWSLTYVLSGVSAALMDKPPHTHTAQEVRFDD